MREEQGTCLAVDKEGFPNSVFVGMGKGGIWKADLAAGSPPTIALTQLPAVPNAPPSYVADLCTVHFSQGNKTFLYAAVAYAGIPPVTNPPTPQVRGVAEYQYDLSSPTSGPSVNMASAGCGFPARVVAVTDGGTGVRVALAQTAFATLTS